VASKFPEMATEVSTLGHVSTPAATQRRNNRFAILLSCGFGNHNAPATVVNEYNAWRSRWMNPLRCP
jgi:hypothetical protein